MDEVVVNKLNEITQWIEATLANSKYIHELDPNEFEGDLYIAVSDGTNTKKVLYKPNEVTKEDFENLYNMNLGSDSNSNTIYIEDANGTMLTSLNLNLFFKDSVKYTAQNKSDEEKEQARANIDAVGNPEMEEVQVPDWSTIVENQINF